MIVELTPETFFENVHVNGPLHVVMHYGQMCGPCKATLPHYEVVMSHFKEYKVTNVKFYKFHQWEQSYTQFIEENNLKCNGVPTFKLFYMGEMINEETKSYNDPNEIKNMIMSNIKAIEVSMQQNFDLHAE